MKPWVMRIDKLEELKELSKAAAKAAEVLTLLQRKAKRHVIKGVKPKRQSPLMTLQLNDKRLQLTDKQVATLLILKNCGGIEVLSVLARNIGLDSRTGLGLVEQLAELELVRLVATPQRKVVLLTPLGWKTTELIEQEISKRSS